MKFIDRAINNYNNIYCIIIILLYFQKIIYPLLITFLYMYSKSNCIICYNTDYICYQMCNKPYDHTVCFKCYTNPYYDRSKCHLCQIKLY